MKNMMSFFRKNAFYVMAIVLVAGILAVSGIAGYVSGQREEKLAENAAEFTDREAVADETADGADNLTTADGTGSDVADEMTGYNADVVQKILNMIEDGTLALEDFEDENSMVSGSVASVDEAETTEDETVVETEPAQEAEAVEVTMNAGYQTGERMMWPVEGEIVVDYSMAETTYFPTLQEYKCNPAILIQSEAGTDVCASYAGTVTDIYNDAQLGTVVEMSLGNGYEAAYGQLTAVEVSVGDTVAEGSVIGEVNEPTRFYSVEGSHLNFQLTKDGEPVDPLDYLE
jgi:murein DD-endopeptidase MepM/ murein hydrolase activator NlpD